MAIFNSYVCLLDGISILKPHASISPRCRKWRRRIPAASGGAVAFGSPFPGAISVGWMCIPNCVPSIGLWFMMICWQIGSKMITMHIIWWQLGLYFVLSMEHNWTIKIMGSFAWTAAASCWFMEVTVSGEYPLIGKGKPLNGDIS